MARPLGVLSDIRERGLDTLEPVAMLYVPIRQDSTNGVTMVVRGSGGVSRLQPAIAGVLAKIDPGLPIRNVRTMDEVVGATIAQHRFSMWLFAALAGLACLLAIVGIYSVLAYSVRGRAQEIGVRMALGASAGDVVRLVIAEGMRPALTGVLLGAFGAFALGGVLSKLIYGVSAADPMTFVAVASLLALVALAACAIPAYRAARMQPVTALRHE